MRQDPQHCCQRKTLVAVCHSFCLFFIIYNIHTEQSSNHIYTIHSPRPLSISSSLVAQWERPPCGAEPGIELGPAFQQADALPTEPRRTTPHAQNLHGNGNKKKNTKSLPPHISFEILTGSGSFQQCVIFPHPDRPPGRLVSVRLSQP